MINSAPANFYSKAGNVEDTVSSVNNRLFNQSNEKRTLYSYKIGFFLNEDVSQGENEDTQLYHIKKLEDFYILSRRLSSLDNFRFCLSLVLAITSHSAA